MDEALVVFACGVGGLSGSLHVIVLCTFGGACGFDWSPLALLVLAACSVANVVSSASTFISLPEARMQRGEAKYGACCMGDPLHVSR